ncbi:serine/threonine-protein kinase H1 homolog [Corythoichthys intestinalis]|uniref:serine/threonine-protein kinase H1 homolog n=1 Tax=Corythoichthys intestinalis TaxID=161448 RepID=UPI0025A54B6C|nr:serine/threonine-protein kinase H1 homolog [Corythoichthys intestinalis]XP_061809985.1 serine/threonine-protein kinase H1 homolog [Nerophis lumbriciformis]
MGCRSAKVLPSQSDIKNDPKKKRYVSVMQSLAAFAREREHQEELKKNKGGWFSTKTKSMVAEVKQQEEKQETYTDKFDARVTARYHIKALIGRGSFSRVVRAEHRSSRRPFAIKMTEVDAPQAREVCAAELAVLRRVNHPNVVRLVEVFQCPRRVYVVLELATGGELLDHVISRGHYTEQDAARALRMVLAGVGYLHSLGITHRDLKPENLLYYHPGVDSRLLVTDFGLATFGGAGTPGRSKSPQSGEVTGTSSSCSLRTTCGTPEYMAPEVVLRKAYTCAVDMWAIGVIAYILLSGSMPFEDDSKTRLYRSIVRGKYSFRRNPWPSVSNPAKDFIRALLESDPGRRPSAQQASRHPWILATTGGSSSRNLHRSVSRNLLRRTPRNSSRTKSAADRSISKQLVPVLS